MQDVSPAILQSKVFDATTILHDHILAASSPREIALARAIYIIIFNQWEKEPRRVHEVFGGQRTSIDLSLAAWHNDAVRQANVIVSWETTTDAAKLAYAKRRKSYEDYVDTIMDRFDLFQAVYKQLAISIRVASLPKTALTSAYVTMLKQEVIPWYDRQRATDQLVRLNPQEGMVRFMNERREMAMMLQTCHAKERAGENRQMASDACVFQLALAPVLGRIVGLYKRWDGTKILKIKDLSELERAVLAMAILVPTSARILKAGRLVYTPDRLNQIYGGELAVWKRAVACSAVLSKQRTWQRVLDDAFNAMEMDLNVKLSGKVLSDAKTTLPQMVSSLTLTGIFREPNPIEPEVTQLWTSLKSKHTWLTTALLDEHALRRVLLMGPNPMQIQAQLLAELAESRIATFLRDRNGVYSLGIEVPEGCTLEFVPGHAFRAGDKNLDIANRQISDGVIGYWQKDVFCVAAILEAKVDGVGGRELGHTKTEMSDLTEPEQAQLRAFSNREWTEAKEVADRKGEAFTKTIEGFDSEILKFEKGSQVTRDIDRLDSLEEVRINGVLARFQLLSMQDHNQTTKILAVVPRAIEPESLDRDIFMANNRRTSQSPFQFEPFAVPVSTAQLTQVAENTVVTANLMVYSVGKALKLVRGPCPDIPVPHPPLLIQGSVHPAVREAQRKLNAFHAYRVDAKLSGLRDAPLVEDCVFSNHTFEAVKSFQKLAFPGKPVKHNGKIDPHTWEQLDTIAVGPVAQLIFQKFSITGNDFSTPLSWDDVIGLQPVMLNLNIVASGLPPATMPPLILVELSSRVPNHASGSTTLNKPVQLEVPRVDPDKANPNWIIYRVSRSLPEIGDFLKVDHKLKEVTTIVRNGGTSDAAFRSGLGWTPRGIGTQPIVDGSSTGSESSEIPDAASLFLSAGVEVLEVKVLDQPNYRVPNTIKRLIRSPAEVVYYSGHGSSVGGKLLIDIDNKPCGGEHGTYRNWIGPGDLTSAWTNPIDLQILIIAGCSVLKIDFSTPTPSGTGLAWAKLLDTKGGPLVILLGYRGSAPCDNPKGDEIARKMAGRMSGGSTNFAQDWLDINGNSNANNAVAMDAKGYWWIEGTAFGGFDIKGPTSIP